MLIKLYSQGILLENWIEFLMSCPNSDILNESQMSEFYFINIWIESSGETCKSHTIIDE